MPFRYVSNLENKFQLMSPVWQFPIVTGVTIQDGAFVNFVNGRAQVAAAGGLVAGVARIYDGVALVGNNAGTVLVDVELVRHQDVFAVDQAAIPAAQCQVGDLLDYDAAAEELAAAGNNDLVVAPYRNGLDTLRNTVFVCVRNYQFP